MAEKAPAIPPGFVVEDERIRGDFVPFSRNRRTGNVSFDPDAGFVGMIKRALTAPKEAVSGELPMFGPEGRTSDEAIGRTFELAPLATGLPPVGQSGRAVGSVLGRPRPAPPTTEELLKTGGKQIKQVRKLPVDYDADSVAQLGKSIANELRSAEFGSHPELAPTTFKFLEEMTNVPKVGPGERALSPIAELVALRRRFGKAAKKFTEPDEQFAAMHAIDRLDEFIMQADPKTVLAGPAARAGEQLAEGRANYAAGKRSQQIRAIESDARRQTASAHSGKTANAIRQALKPMLRETGTAGKRLRAGFSNEELAALDAVIDGSFLANRTRGISNKLGAGGGIGQMGVGGGAGLLLEPSAGGVALGILGVQAAGGASRTATLALTKKALRDADAMIRMRSPIYEQMFKDTPWTDAGVASRVAFIRGSGMLGNAAQSN